MKYSSKLPMAAVIFASAFLAAPQDASAVVIVDALANSTTGGVGISSGVNVVAGDDLWITAGPGCWSAGSGDERTSDADGIIPGAANPCNSTSNSFPQWTQGGLTANFGALVGSLDGGTTFFLIGTVYNQIATQTGLLTLYYFDSKASDNSGSISVDVVNHGQPPPPNGGTNVPEPTSLLLIGAGLAGLAVARRRRRSS